MKRALPVFFTRLIELLKSTALAAPITLVLRLSSGETRRRWLIPFLHSRVTRETSVT